MQRNKQYYLEFGGSLLLYMIAVFLSTSSLNDIENTNWRAVVSLIPIFPASLMIIVVIRAIHKMDELQQKIQLMGFAISFAIVGLATFSYGFLEIAGFTHIPYVWIFPFMIATWGICTQIVSRLYK